MFQNNKSSIPLGIQMTMVNGGIRKSLHVEMNKLKY